MSAKTPNQTTFLDTENDRSGEIDRIGVAHDAPALRARRTLLLRMGSILALSVFSTQMSHAAQILAVRVWPAADYTRVTIENDSQLKTSHFLLKNPLRLFVDIEGLELDGRLKEIVAKIRADDPYIKQVRVGQNRPNVVRLVFDLKAEITPQVFTLPPAGQYRHRLVFDLYPVQIIDPLASMIETGKWPEPAVTSQSASQLSATNPSTNTASSPATSSKPVDVASASSSTNNESTRAQKYIIALDPGHGGEDPGAIGRAGSREKDVVLAIAQRLKQKFETSPDFKVLLTRDGDFYVPLNKRVQKARAVKADLFVSIHADAFTNTSARGSSVFALSEKGASSAAARWLADKENEADLIGGINLASHDQQVANVLLDLSTSAQIHDSLKLGKIVLSEISQINKLHKNNVEQAGFAVLKAPDIPSILIETAFISNPEEEKRLNDEDYQSKFADAIFRGIKYYLKHHPLPDRKA